MVSISKSSFTNIYDYRTNWCKETTMKTLIALLALTSTSAFAFINDGNGNTSGGASSTMNGNAEGTGTANFTMSFSGSARTKGNFKTDGEGDLQNMFTGNDYQYRPYYYPNQEK